MHPLTATLHHLLPYSKHRMSAFKLMLKFLLILSAVLQNMAVIALPQGEMAE